MSMESMHKTPQNAQNSKPIGAKRTKCAGFVGSVGFVPKGKFEFLLTYFSRIYVRTLEPQNKTHRTHKTQLSTVIPKRKVQPMEPEFEDLLDSIASSLASIAENLKRLADEGIDANCYSHPLVHPVKIETV